MIVVMLAMDSVEREGGKKKERKKKRE